MTMTPFMSSAIPKRSRKSGLIAAKVMPRDSTTASLVSGAEYRATDLQFSFFEQASRFVATGRADGLVPGAHEIMSVWEDTLDKLDRRDMAALSGRLDWVCKMKILTETMEAEHLSWDSPEIKYLDHLYHSLDPAEGIYWALEKDGSVERIVSEEKIQRFADEPPPDTRAYTRAHLLRRAARDSAFLVRDTSHRPCHAIGDRADLVCCRNRQPHTTPHQPASSGRNRHTAYVAGARQ